MVTTLEFLKLLTPQDCVTLKKIRIGNPSDGGYVMVDDFPSASQKPFVAFSFGVANEVSWDNHMASLGAHVFLFDHTAEVPSSIHKNCTFYKKGLTTRSQQTEDLLSLETHIKNLSLQEKDAILKMDIEGHEWEVFASLSKKTLNQFSQIVCEFHHLDRIKEPQERVLYYKALKNILESFHLVHVHANNYGSRKNPNLSYMDGFFVPHTLELTFIHKDRDQFKPSETWFPTELDAPCCARKPDMALSFFPFAPTHPKKSPLWPDQSPVGISLSPPKETWMEKIKKKTKSLLPNPL